MSTILIVDDEPANLDLLEALLTPTGHRIRTATGAIPALSEVKEERPDLILLDLMMPGMSGFEVCEQLRADAETAGIPVIIVSAVSQLGGTERARALVVDDFLAKPIQPAEVLERVEALLQAHSLRRDLERGLADLHVLDVRRRAHRRRVFAGMQGETVAPSRDTEADSGGVLLLLRDAHCTRCFSGNLTAEPGGQVVRAVSSRETLDARILDLKASSFV
jgi:CheY-like chemotaxis protein